MHIRTTVSSQIHSSSNNNKIQQCTSQFNEMYFEKSKIEENLSPNNN